MDESVTITMKDIAQAAGVSKSTVSRALANDLQIPEKTCQRIQQLARDMGYRPSSAMSAAMRSARSAGKIACKETLACVVPQFVYDVRGKEYKSARWGYFKQRALFRGLSDAAHEVGCELDIFYLSDTPLERLSSILTARGIRRVIFLGCDKSSAISPGLLDDLCDQFLCVFGRTYLSRGLHGQVIQSDLFEMGRMCFIRGWQAGYRHFHLFGTIKDLDMERRFEAGLRLATGELLGYENDFVSKPFQPNPVEKEKDRARWFDALDSTSCIIGGFPPDPLLDLIKRRMKMNAPPGLMDWRANDLQAIYPVAGIDQKDYEQGRRLVEVVLNTLDHRGGMPQVLQQHLVEIGWIDGESLPRVRNSHLNMDPSSHFEQMADERLAPVDLSSVSNICHHPGIFPQDRLNPSSPPPGDWMFHDVPFHVEGTQGYPDLVLIENCKSSMPHRLGEKSEYQNRWIGLRGKARALYFLHTAFGVEKSEPIAWYRLHYHGRESVELPVIPYGPDTKKGTIGQEDLPPNVNIQDWFSDFPKIAARSLKSAHLFNMIALNGLAGNIYVFRWENPYPEWSLRGLEIASNPDSSAQILLYAVTLGR